MGRKRGRNAFTSQMDSVQSYQPYYPAPFVPVSGDVNADPRHGLFEQVNSVGSRWDQHTTFVNREPRRLGIRTLFSYGGQTKPWFRMIATGAVESTAFQPRTTHTWSGQFNDALYQAGYPRNLGTSFKVASVNEGINAPWLQTPRPNFRGRSIFVNARPTTSGVQGVPAQSRNGMYT